tara:strand:- start:1653 stop:2357 length:705 start_codon:yes stop_codon:yes gene_type:complete
MKNIKVTKTQQVKRVFDHAFQGYDLMNDLMSLGIHRIWKRRLIDWMGPKEGDCLLDVASGTGDIAKLFLKRIQFKGEVTCIEPNKKMFGLGKIKLKDYKKVNWICSSAEDLPVKRESFDFYTVSFGIRNFSDIDRSLKEAKRVLKNGGRIMCLEFSKVENETLDKIYKFYSKSIPILGKYITGKSEPYEYLIGSIERFHNQDELLQKFKENGFQNVEYRNLSGGIVSIHSGWKI